MINKLVIIVNKLIKTRERERERERERGEREFLQLVLNAKYSPRLLGIKLW